MGSTFGGQAPFFLGGPAGEAFQGLRLPLGLENGMLDGTAHNPVRSPCETAGTWLASALASLPYVRGSPLATPTGDRPQAWTHSLRSQHGPLPSTHVACAWGVPGCVVS